MALLKSAGIVRSVRGPGGGYMLARSPREVSVSECVDFLEGNGIAPDCVTDSTLCARSHNCATRRLWMGLQKTVSAFFESVTMQSLIDRSHHSAPDYQI